MHQKNFVICDQEADYARKPYADDRRQKRAWISDAYVSEIGTTEKIRRTKANPDLADRRGISQEERLEIPAAERFVLVKQKGGIWQTKKRSFISISQLIRF